MLYHDVKGVFLSALRTEPRPSPDSQGDDMPLLCCRVHYHHRLWGQMPGEFSPFLEVWSVAMATV